MVDIERARNGLRLGRHLEFGPHTERTLRRAAASGALERVRPGVFRALPTVQQAASGRERAEAARREYLERVAAVVLTRTRMPVLSHAAALAVWDLPRTRRWPDVVDIVVGAASAARSKNGVRVHRESYRDEDVVELDGYLVTSPARTGIDLARAGDFVGAIVALDAVLGERRPAGFQSVDRDELFTCLADVTSTRGKSIAARAVAFADGRSGSAGESEARVVIHKLGFPEPELQLRHRSSRGGHYFTDFEWPQYRVIGEFDGLGKYLKAEIPAGADPGQAVYEEKLREDDLRDEGNRVSRWGWHEQRHPALLRQRLSRAGLRSYDAPCSDAAPRRRAATSPRECPFRSKGAGYPGTLDRNGHSRTC